MATERDKKKTDVGKFTRTFCADCHGAEVQEAERSFSQFKLPIKTVAQLITADEIIDQLTLKSMPPSDAPQPDDQQRVKLITHLREAIAEARGRFD
ncbi:MAG: c-type cytochrome domain-containing protein, partial [Pirellulales bacterium]